MKSSSTNFRRILRNATLGLGLAAAVGGASMAPALAADYWQPGRRDVYSHQDRRAALAQLRPPDPLTAKHVADVPLGKKPRPRDGASLVCPREAASPAGIGH